MSVYILAESSGVARPIYDLKGAVAMDYTTMDYRKLP